jgi:hypothetical protein
VNDAKPVLLLFLLILSLSLAQESFLVHAQNAPSIRIEPEETPMLDVGEQFTINVTVKNCVDVFAAQVWFRYDPMILNVTNIPEGPFLSSVTQTLIVQNKTDLYLDAEPPTAIIKFANSMASSEPIGASGSGLLLSVTFEVISEGSSQFQFITHKPNTNDGTFFYDFYFNEIIPDVLDAFYSSPISLSANPSTISVGENTTLSGQVLGASSFNVTSVTLQYRQQGGNWSDLATVSTNSSGHFDVPWRASTDGVFEFQAAITIAGITTYSKVVGVTVQQTGIPIIYVGIGAIVLIIVVVAAVLVYRRRKGKEIEEPPLLP